MLPRRLCGLCGASHPRTGNCTTATSGARLGAEASEASKLHGLLRGFEAPGAGDLQGPDRLISDLAAYLRRAHAAGTRTVRHPGRRRTSSMQHFWAMDRHIRGLLLLETPDARETKRCSARRCGLHGSLRRFLRRRPTEERAPRGPRERGPSVALVPRETAAAMYASRCSPGAGPGHRRQPCPRA